MAKVWLDRLKKKYKGAQVSGSNYQELIGQIIANNTSNVQNKIAKITDDKFTAVAKKYRKKEIRMVMPDVSDVLPKSAVHLRKSAEKGELIADTLRDNLTKNLKDRLNTFSDKTGEQAFVTRRGAKSGRINKDLLNGFEQDITKTFTEYTKRNPKFGMPSNVHTIAVTEVRSAVNEIKGEYVAKLLEKNPGLQVKKKWIQNRGLSKEPRRGHDEVNGKIVPFDGVFKVPRYKTVKGKQKRVEFTAMRFPHDPSAPGDQVIGCNCDYDIIITKEPKGKAV